MANYYTPIKRNYIDMDDSCFMYKKGLFIARGQMSNGQLAYSRIDSNGNECEECEWIQVRYDGRLVMCHL